MHDVAENIRTLNMPMMQKRDIVNQITKITTAARLGLDLVEQHNPTPIRSMHLYTDGSYHSEEQAGFAVTLIAKHTDGSYTFQGAVAGHLDTDAELCMANGPISNNTAETVAIIWALVMAAALQGHYDVVIHPDSTTAMGAAKVGPASEANRLIGIIANGMHHYVSEQRNLSYEHIHGHTGHPWN